MTQRRQLILCVACLLSGVVVGYTLRLRTDKEHSYRDVREWRTIDAAGEVFFASEALQHLRDGNTNAVRKQLEEQLSASAAHLREHYSEFDTKELYYADRALQLAPPR